MSAPNDGGSAFPAQPVWHLPGGDTIVANQGGMSLRDFFAAKAMQAFVADDDPYKLCGDMIAERLMAAARYSYQMADAMLAARGKP